MITIRFIIRIAIFVLIPFIAIDSMAQNPGGGNRDFSSMPAEGIVIGKILDKSLNAPMEYANLVLYSMRDSSIVAGTVTNADGTFRMEKVQYGRFYAIANFIGYKKTFINDIRISPKQKIVELAHIYLEPASTNLQGIEVVADRDHVEYKIDKKIVNIADPAIMKEYSPYREIMDQITSYLENMIHEIEDFGI